MAISPNLVYTWESFKGDLSLYDRDGVYSLSFTKDNETIDIPKENIKGISFEDFPSKVDEFCQTYFFRIQKKEDKHLVSFFESEEVLDNFKVSEEDGQAQKSLGSIGYEFNKLERKKMVEITDKAPDYRRICKGLNLEGMCMNKVCDAFEKFVIVPKGVGEFQLAEELDESQCPACDQNIPSTNMSNLGFWNTVYTIKGKQLRPEEKSVDRTETAGKEQYTTFKAGDDCTWAYLNITTKEVKNEGRSCVIL